MIIKAEEHDAVRARITAAIGDLAIKSILVTGEARSGKTHLCRSAVELLGPNAHLLEWDMLAAQAPAVLSTISPAGVGVAPHAHTSTTRLDMFVTAAASVDRHPSDPEPVTVIFADDVDAALSVMGTSGIATLASIMSSVRATPRPRCVLLMTSTASDPFAVQSKVMKEIAAAVGVRIALTAPTSADMMAEARAAGRRRGKKMLTNADADAAAAPAATAATAMTTATAAAGRRMHAGCELGVMTLEAAAAWDGGNESLAWEASVIRAYMHQIQKE